MPELQRHSTKLTKWRHLIKERHQTIERVYCNYSVCRSRIAETVESSIGEIKDSLTSITKQINSRDKSVSESIVDLTSSTNTIKSTFEHKTNKLLNKTNADLNKVKTQGAAVNNTHKQSKTVQKSEVKHPNENKELSEKSKKLKVN